MRNMPIDKHSRRARPEDIRLSILEAASTNSPHLVQSVVATFRISRQAAHRHVQGLIQEGSLVAAGKTRARTYSLALLESRSATLHLEGTEEHQVWLDNARGIMQSVPGSVEQMAHFCFTEIVNNSIDHSGGTMLRVIVERTALWVRMVVIDDGIGIFRKIKEALNLDDERHAMLELTKGKFTTDPSAHSGLGIYFSSKACDEFVISSRHIGFGHVRGGADFLIDDRPVGPDGTGVTMVIRVDSSETMGAIYARHFSPENPGFSRTTIPVAVAQYGDENLVSRSQAKRVLLRVDRFKEVIFDFAGVSFIGQAFADEIFRVFSLTHPDVHLLAANAAPEVQAMIDLALGKE